MKTRNGFLFLLLFISGLNTAPAEAQDLSHHFKNINGAFVLYDLNENHYIRYNEQRCRERFSPKSTFKIPNSLIGLETGVIRDADFTIGRCRHFGPCDKTTQGGTR